MRARSIARAVSMMVIAAVPVTTLAGGDVALKEPDYEMGEAPPHGDPLPVDGPVIRVYSEGGDRFDFVGHRNEPVRFYGQLTGSCPRLYKISALEFRVFDVNVPVSHPDGRGAWFSRTGAVDVPHAQLQGFDAVAACNDALKTLAVESGRARSELIAEGFGVRFPGFVEGRAILLCTGRSNSDSDTEKLDLWVSCVGNPKAAQPKMKTAKVVPAKLTPFITDLTFEVDRPTYLGRCPVGLVFTGSITASRAGTVRYRTVAQDGSSSPVYTLSFGAAGTKSISRWGETLSEPDPSGRLAGAAGTAGPDHSGWRRLEIVEPSGFAPSPAAEYSVTCRQEPLTLRAAPVAPTAPPERMKR